MPSFQNRVAVIINSSFFERDLRKRLNRRCDYLELLNFITKDCSEVKIDHSRKNGINSEYRLNEIVRALYFHSEMIYKNGKFERRNSPNHNNFLNALRSF